MSECNINKQSSYLIQIAALFEEKKNTRKTTNLLSIAFASKGNVF